MTKFGIFHALAKKEADEFWADACGVPHGWRTIIETAVRQGMTPEEIIALARDPVDPRVAHLF